MRGGACGRGRAALGRNIFRSRLGLSDEDYEYLKKTQSLERYDAPILHLSPKEFSRLHNLINDPQPDAAVRDKNVKDILGLFLEHQLWERAHPGELWDAPKK